MAKSRTASANEAYANLIVDPQNSAEIEKLKSKDTNLYALYKFRTESDAKNSAGIAEVAAMDIDPILKSIAEFASGDNSADIMQNYNYLRSGYALLKENKIADAKAELAKIPTDSPLAELAGKLLHYNGKQQ